MNKEEFYPGHNQPGETPKEQEMYYSTDPILVDLFMSFCFNYPPEFGYLICGVLKRLFLCEK